MKTGHFNLPTTLAGGDMAGGDSYWYGKTATPPIGLGKMGFTSIQVFG